MSNKANFHIRSIPPMVHHEQIPGTKTGRRIILECGHTILVFGDLALTGGFISCQQCRDQEEAAHE